MRSGLLQAVNALAVGGRLVVISFHSLEDRIVKRFFQKLTRPEPGNRRLPVNPETEAPLFKSTGKFLPTADEIANNSRSRSAVLRVIQRVAVGEVLV